MGCRIYVIGLGFRSHVAVLFTSHLLLHTGHDMNLDEDLDLADLPRYASLKDALQGLQLQGTDASTFCVTTKLARRKEREEQSPFLDSEGQDRCERRDVPRVCLHVRMRRADTSPM